MEKFIFLIISMAAAAMGACSGINKYNNTIYDSVEIVNGKVVNAPPKGEIGKMTTKSYKLDSEISRITNYTLADIEFFTGPARMEVTAPENLIDNLKILEKGPTLTLRSDNLTDAKIKIWLPTLDEITLKGVGDFSAGLLKSNRLNINLEGVGDVNIERIQTPLLTANATGTGDININKVETPNAQFIMVGTSDLNIKEVEAIVLKLKCQGVGKIDISSVEGNQIDLLLQGTGDAYLNNIDIQSLRIVLPGVGNAKVSGKSGSAIVNLSGLGTIDISKLKCDNVSKKVNGLGNIVE